jgi:hypothetical protein
LLRGADSKDPEGEKKKEKVDYSKVGFEWLGELAAEHGFRTLVVVFPYFEPFDAYPRHAQAAHDRAHRYASDHGFEVLDLLPAFREASDGDATALRGRCWSVHPDEKGHAVAAEEIAEYLLASFNTAP